MLLGAEAVDVPSSPGFTSFPCLFFYTHISFFHGLTACEMVELRESQKLAPK